MKLGRNKPCHCGSGKKYKKCCLEKDQLASPENIARMREELNEKIKEQAQRLAKRGIFMNYVKPIINNGKKVFAIGNRVYYERPVHETFEEFLLFNLYQVLGIAWVTEQRAAKNPHFLAKCFNEYNDWKRNNATEMNKVSEFKYGMVPNGFVHFLHTFAFDIATLVHKESLPGFFIKRLQNKKEFQGARYEVTIAAIFTRLGFDVKFLDEDSNPEPHGEFITKHIQSGLEIVVEVKSRHREGILHEKVHKTEIDQLKPKLQNITKQALSKNKGDKPFIAFVDVNLPANGKSVFQELWFEEIKQWAAATDGKISEDNPATHSAIIYTNFSPHYNQQDFALGGGYLLLLPKYSKNVIYGNFYDQLLTALENYGFIPSDYDL